jgi:hypothetical protein
MERIRDSRAPLANFGTWSCVGEAGAAAYAGGKAADTGDGVCGAGGAAAIVTILRKGHFPINSTKTI